MDERLIVLNSDKRAFYYALTAVLLWSTVATAFKITLMYLSPLQMVAVASLVSWMVFFCIAWRQQQLKAAYMALSERPLFFLLCGLLNPAVYYLVLFEAYALLPASQAQPLNYTWAIALTFMAAIFLKQRIRKRDWCAAALGYFGVAIIATKGDILNMELASPTGVLLALTSTILWAGYWIINTRQTYPPVVSLLLGFSIATPLLLTLTTLTHGWSNIAWQGWVAVSYVGLFEMGITFFLWLKAMRETSNVSLISNLIFISPFISLLLLAAIIGETIYPATVVGLLLIVTGLLLQRLTRRWVPQSFIPLRRWWSRPKRKRG